MIEQHDFTSLIRIDQDIKNKIVLCAGKGAEALSNWALENEAHAVLVINDASKLDENYDIPEGVENVHTVIARHFFSKFNSVHDRRSFVGVMKRVGVDAWYVETKEAIKVAQEVEATGEFGYLMTNTDFKNTFRMQLDDGII